MRGRKESQKAQCISFSHCPVMRVCHHKVQQSALLCRDYNWTWKVFLLFQVALLLLEQHAANLHRLWTVAEKAQLLFLFRCFLLFLFCYFAYCFSLYKLAKLNLFSHVHYNPIRDTNCDGKAIESAGNHWLYRHLKRKEMERRIVYQHSRRPN